MAYQERPYRHQIGINGWGSLRLLGISQLPRSIPGAQAHFSLHVECEQEELIVHLAGAAHRIALGFDRHAYWIRSPCSGDRWQRILFKRHIPDLPISSEGVRVLLRDTSKILQSAENAGKESYAEELKEVVIYSELTPPQRDQWLE